MYCWHRARIILDWGVETCPAKGHYLAPSEEVTLTTIDSLRLKLIMQRFKAPSVIEAFADEMIESFKRRPLYCLTAIKLNTSESEISPVHPSSFACRS